jgi:YD repeat-containing protein
MCGGCKKAPAVNGLVASYSESQTSNGQTTNTTFIYTYDGQGRLTEFQPSNSTPQTFAYGSGSVTIIDGSTTIILTLNSAGLATMDNQGNTYVYDNNGYLITTSNPTAGASSTNTISNGNIANSTSTSNGVTTNFGYTYLSTVDYRNYGQAYLGKSSADLINTLSISNPNTTTYTFSYTYDSKGRVQTQTVIAGTTTDIRTYTYTD